MSTKLGVTGLNVTLAALNKELQAIENRTLTGLIRGGAIVRRAGQIITPVDTGNLVNSWYGPEPVAYNSVEIGLTANYAPYVHEMIDANFQKPGAQAKFLETPLKENSEKVLEAIRQEAQIK